MYKVCLFSFVVTAGFADAGIVWHSICDQILQNRSKSHIRQNLASTTSGQLHYHTSSFDTQYHSNYSRLVSTNVFSGGMCGAGMAVLDLVKDLAWKESVVYWWTA